MIDRSTIIQIIGGLMKRPQYLSETDKYILTPDDFVYRFDKYLFTAIDNLYRDGATRINPIDVENFLNTNETAKLIFKQNNGIEYLQDADYLSDENNFPYYYKKLKKFNLLISLEKDGINTSTFYIEEPKTDKELEINEKFEELEIEDILNEIKKKVTINEKKYLQSGEVESWNLAEEIDELIEGFGETDSFGLSINGDICSKVINGAEIGALTIRSASSGLGKTRLAVADACKLAFPFIFNSNSGKWEKTGHGERVLFIMTEQTKQQILRMVMAYVTDIDDSKLRFGRINEEERKRVIQARDMIKSKFNNLVLMRIPDPNVEQIKVAVREKVIVENVKYVFFDYIFISPAILNEFRGSIRDDEALLLMATALKNLAIEQNISVFTSTQVNAKADDNKNIRNEASLAGGRSTINKADNGIIASRPTKEELEFFSKELNNMCGKEPNIVFDVYKVRSGQWTQIRIWSYFNAGTLKLEDLFITDSRLNILTNFFEQTYSINWEMSEEEMEYLNLLNKDNKPKERNKIINLESLI